MKKILWITVGFMVAVLVFGIVGFAYAQSQTPPTPEFPYGPGMHAQGAIEGMGGYGRGYGHGMMAGYSGMHALSGVEGMDWDGEYGPMHDTMITALAEALDLTPEELEARHDAGETMWQIAESEGLSAEAIQDLMSSAHDTALEDAVANGWLTDEQADWMDTHMDQMWNGEYEYGGFGGHCGGGGWNTNTRWQSDN